MSYAYDPSNKKYNFLTIKKELKNEDVDYSLELVDNDDLNIVKDTINTIK
jgi:hypothetical protein